MGQSSVTKVTELIRGHSLRVRTGILLLSTNQLGKEVEEAIRLQVEAVDIRQLLLDDLPVGTKMIGLSAEKVEELLDQIANNSGGNDCVLVFHFDLLMARLRQSERRSVWNYTYFTMPHRRRGLLIAMPETATDLLPTVNDLEQWDNENRLAKYQ